MRNGIVFIIWQISLLCVLIGDSWILIPASAFWPWHCSFRGNRESSLIGGYS